MVRVKNDIWHDFKQKIVKSSRRKKKNKDLHFTTIEE